MGSQAGRKSAYVLDTLVNRGAVSHHRLGVGWPRWSDRPAGPGRSTVEDFSEDCGAAATFVVLKAISSGTMLLD